MSQTNYLKDAEMINQIAKRLEEDNVSKLNELNSVNQVTRNMKTILGKEIEGPIHPYYYKKSLVSYVFKKLAKLNRRTIIHL